MQPPIHTWPGTTVSVDCFATDFYAFSSALSVSGPSLPLTKRSARINLNQSPCQLIAMSAGFTTRNPLNPLPPLTCFLIVNVYAGRARVGREGESNPDRADQHHVHT